MKRMLDLYYTFVAECVEGDEDGGADDHEEDGPDPLPAPAALAPSCVR